MNTHRSLRLFSLSLAVLGGACSADNPDFLGGDGSAGGPNDAGNYLAASDAQIAPAAPFDPSHVGSDWFGRGTADLVLGASVDTTALTLDGQAPPQGVVFMESQGLAVLAVHSLTVPGDKKVRVRGSRPLVVVATQSISIAGVLDGAAHLDEPGPGGSGAGQGMGAGHAGGGSPLDSGGSGAGYHDVGGPAGGVGGNFCGQGATPRNPGGTMWGDAILTQLVGGAGGGSGSLGGRGCPAGSDCHGGAGGGAIQLTAGAVVGVTGKINVGGGGGKGGCKNPQQNDSGSGGGGGSGGSLLVEALAIDLSGGVLAANGGGGGGGSFDTTGGNGADGQASNQSAAGGAGGKQNVFGSTQEVTAQRGGGGGTIGAGGTSSDAGNCGNSGGGGGASGRIYVRSRTPTAQANTVISPPAASGIIP